MALTIKQKKLLEKHKKHHTTKHIKAMTTEMNKGKTFAEAHKLAIKKVGK